MYLNFILLVFVRQQTGTEGRSSSLESEDETEVPPLLRTISMETDDVSAGVSEVAGGTTPCFAGSSSSLESAAVTTPAPARKIQMQVGNSVVNLCRHFLCINYLSPCPFSSVPAMCWLTSLALYSDF